MKIVSSLPCVVEITIGSDSRCRSARVMFLGTFLSDPVNIAVGVIGYMASQLLLALLAQALGLTMEAIRGGRQVAVMTIFGQSGFQLAYSFAQLRHLFSQD